MSEVKLQSQLRAAFAFQCIDKASKSMLQSELKELRSYIQKMPAMIQMNGFGQTVAFYKAHMGQQKGAIAYQMLYSWLSTWLKEQEIFKQDLMQAICEGSMHQYQLATAETQALLAWLVKFARAYIKSEE